MKREHGNSLSNGIHRQTYFARTKSGITVIIRYDIVKKLTDECDIRILVYVLADTLRYSCPNWHYFNRVSFLYSPSNGHSCICLHIPKDYCHWKGETWTQRVIVTNIYPHHYGTAPFLRRHSIVWIAISRTREQDPIPQMDVDYGRGYETNASDKEYLQPDENN